MFTMLLTSLTMLLMVAVGPLILDTNPTIRVSQWIALLIMVPDSALPFVQGVNLVAAPAVASIGGASVLSGHRAAHLERQPHIYGAQLGHYPLWHSRGGCTPRSTKAPRYGRQECSPAIHSPTILD